MTLALARRAFAARAALLRLSGASAAGRPPSLAQAAAWQRHQELLRRRSSWLANAAAASGGDSAADGSSSVSPQQQRRRQQQQQQQQRREGGGGGGGASKKKPRLPSHWECPACGTRCVRPGVFARHLRACCPDLIPPDAWREATANAEAGGSVVSAASSPSSSSPSSSAAANANAALSAESIAAAERLLAGAKRAEEALRERILELSFRTLPPPPLPPPPTTTVSGDEAGGSGAPPPPPLPFSRMPVRDVAERLGLPEKRVASSLKLAVRATPLVADHDAPAAEVLFEDGFVLALAKPSGIITAPKHRHEGGSLVARAIAHLNGKGKEEEGEEKKEEEKEKERSSNSNNSSSGESAPLPPPSPSLLRLPFPVHRLDMATSGVVVMGKTSAAAAALQAQFRGRTARKTYLALVAGGGGGGVGGGAGGRRVGERWEVDAAIGRHPRLKVGRRAVAVEEGRGGGREGSGGSVGGDSDGDAESDNGGGDDDDDDDDDSAAQPALTRFAVLARCDGAAVERAMRRGGGRGGGGGDCSSSSVPFSSLYALGELAEAEDTLRSLRGGAALLACAPRTGRTHQIRVHASFCGHPILGDDLYGPVPLVNGKELAPRLLLHAAALELEHPESYFSSSSSSSSGGEENEEKKKRLLRLSAPLPPEFRRTMEALGMEWSFEELPRDLWD